MECLKIKQDRKELVGQITAKVEPVDRYRVGKESKVHPKTLFEIWLNA